ncbi:hypothetical protein [Haliangium ochraceum]|uniref:Uncharacterized protein n=1 Tax=Haliangium ochraceum (strain DSM 14365 / JCM 11303 / SMP-2) TaxID=502025 RepID=D0LFQ2_HALO1|nr:hypothetical protein [Haliangium ochraceum]ACY12686.1 hypothetical protein Hoch_0044 [Haliangium ochraceum DSM 14365]
MGNEIVLRKLTNAMGVEKGQRLMTEVLGHLGLQALTTPNDRYNFGSELIRRGGVGKLIGQSITMQARLHGAKV